MLGDVAKALGLLLADRERIGREASPTAVVLNNQASNDGEHRPLGLRRWQGHIVSQAVDDG